MTLYSRCLIVAVIGLGMLAAEVKADPVELLMRLEGAWEVNLGKMGGGKQAVCAGKKIAGGKGVYTLFKRPLDKGTYEAHALWTYDNQTGKVFVYELNSYGEVFEHVGSFKKDGSLYLVRKKRAGKRVVVQKTLMTWKGPDEIVSKIEEKVKGKWESYTFTFKKNKEG